MKCTWNAHEMHMKCTWNALEMHIYCTLLGLFWLTPTLSKALLWMKRTCNVSQKNPHVFTRALVWVWGSFEDMRARLTHIANSVHSRQGSSLINLALCRHNYRSLLQKSPIKETIFCKREHKLPCREWAACIDRTVNTRRRRFWMYVYRAPDLWKKTNCKFC